MGSARQFTAMVASRNGVAGIAVDGELDMTTVSVLSAHLGRSEADGLLGIMLDLRDVMSVDSSGLRTVLEAGEHSSPMKTVSC